MKACRVGSVSILTLVLPLFSHAEGGKTLVFGLGGDSCATVLARNSYSDKHWALGYWSGLNAAHRGTVGISTDANGIIGEVESVCRSEPSIAYAGAIIRVYERLKAEKR